ncbi:MAG TPA: FtsQ-type POTRA domain-containing protein [Acidimicrobiales bacterium]|jgi:cell division protein FtsQ
MEPRIRVRRAQVRRQEGRRRLHVLVAVAVCLCVAVVAWTASRSPLLDVDRVVVDGASLTGASTARGASGVERGTAMVDIDESAVANRLRSLPWVRSASVRRDWPGTLRLGLVERTPVAITPASVGGWALIDREGRVLTASATPAPGLLVVAGLPPAGPPGTTLGAAARGLLDVVGAIPGGLRPLVTNLTVDTNGINLGLAPGGTILLGGADDVAAKMRSAELVLQGVDTTKLAVLDVRLPKTPTITRIQS